MFVLEASAGAKTTRIVSETFRPIEKPFLTYCINGTIRYAILIVHATSGLFKRSKSSSRTGLPNSVFSERSTASEQLTGSLPCGRWQQQEGDVMCQQYSAFDSTVYILRRREKDCWSIAIKRQSSQCGGAVQERSKGVSFDSDILMHGMLAIFGQLFYCMICVLFFIVQTNT